MTNRYAGKCKGCGTQVAAGSGEARKGDSGKWELFCTSCKSGKSAAAATPKPKRTYELTEEQQVAVKLFSTGKSLAIEAGAGTGKTSTLVAIAESTDRRGSYVAFNKAIVTDAGEKLPPNVSASTAHSLAFRQVGRQFAHRLNSNRQKNDEIARRLGISAVVIDDVGDGSNKVLQPGYLAALAIRGATAFCQSADTEPQERHIAYIDGIDFPEDGRRTYENNNLVRSYLLPFVQAVWADWKDPKGQLRYSHDAYLKFWQLNDPQIPGDFILFDEAQDANPVLIAAVAAQDKQIVWVGDSQQQIYSWRGAVNALASVPAEQRCFLTHSFRFGPEIAGAANKVLEQIEGAELRITGRGAAGALGAHDKPNCILTRTNAGAIGAVLGALDAGASVHLVGGGGDIERFCEAAQQLQAGRRTSHPDLACFESWSEVQKYVKEGEADDIKLLVNLIDKYTAATILRAVANTTPEDKADVIVSTAHKSKGREWNVVQLGADFPTKLEEAGEEEKRLLYVAVTRAKLHLDHTGSEGISALLREPKTEGTSDPKAAV
jgi:hypothetical protein